MKSYNHFIVSMQNTLLNRGRHCCELEQSGKVGTVHLCSCRVIHTHTHTRTLTCSLHRHTWTSVVTLRLFLLCTVQLLLLLLHHYLLWYNKHTPGEEEGGVSQPDYSELICTYLYLKKIYNKI